MDGVGVGVGELRGDVAQRARARARCACDEAVTDRNEREATTTQSRSGAEAG